MKSRSKKSTRFILLTFVLLSLPLQTGCKEKVAKSPQPLKASVPAEDTSGVSAVKSAPTPVEYVEVDMGSVLPPMKVPVDNPITPEKIALGKKLFFDTALSVDRSMSCATCHDPELGWGNGQKIAEGAGGVRGKRNVLSILNVGFYDKHLFWDGRVKTLEQQALIPVFEATEMGMKSEEQLLERINSDEEYKTCFAEAFDDGVTAVNVARALATFQRTIYVKEIPYDRYLAGDKTAMSESAIRGARVFSNRRKANCASCHPAPMFTDQDPYNVGIGMDQAEPDWGFHHTKGWAFWGKFRSPSLRGIDQTAPYMHDGSLATLEEVVDYYDRGGISHEYTDNAITNVGLTRMSERDKKDLVTFLREGLREIKDGE